MSIDLSTLLLVLLLIFCISFVIAITISCICALIISKDRRVTWIEAHMEYLELLIKRGDNNE